ncbi:MAG: hypothetical protein K6E75_03005, partial [Lachnospiraceae bacterium]|nr:hypothetical protein [Lachnospiraceae bacterium]
FGSPQNLFLYQQSGMKAGHFMLHMLPLSVSSAILLIIFVMVMYRKERICEGLSKFKDYGFESENQMIRVALLRFLSDKLSDHSPEELADLIADRLRQNLAMPVVTTPVETMSTGSSDEAYDAAMSFLDSL